MRKLATLFVVSMAFLAASYWISQARNNPEVTLRPALTERYIVVFRDNVRDPLSAANDIARAHGLKLGHVYRWALKGFAATIPPGRLNAIENDPRVKYIAPDQIDRAFAQTLPTGINRSDADLNPSANVDVDIAIIDTGIFEHPDLNIAGGINFSSANRDKWNDGNGHGTHVAGTAAALDNGIGVVGVAPGARLWAVRVLKNNGMGFRSDIIKGIDWVTQNAATIEVVNMSLGGVGSDDGNCGQSNNDPEHEAICNSVAAGVVYVVSAGNDEADAKNSVPAAYSEVITVSALADFDGIPGGTGSATCRTDEDDSLAKFSNYGAGVDLMAPGVCIESTWNDGGTRTISGTSMASPHVAGAAALYIAANARATDADGVAAIRDALVNAGIHQTDPSCGLSTFDDTDGYAERLLFANAVALGGTGVCGGGTVPDPDDTTPPVISNEAATNITGSSATITWTTDEPANSTVDYGPDDNYGSIASGLTLVTSHSITLTGLAATTTYHYKVTSKDGAGNLASSSDDFQFTTTAAALTAETMHVSDISYATKGGRNKRLLITIEVEDNLNDLLNGAAVSITLTHESGSSWIGSGNTGDNGTVTFSLRGAPSGCYTTAIDNVTHPDLSYVSGENTPSPDPGTCI